MKIGEVIQRVQSLYSKGVESDDSRLSSRHIYNKLLTVRSRLVVQRLRKNQPFSEWDLQPLHCIEMENQTPLSCGKNITCPFMKSKYPLPSSITTGEDENVVVTSATGKTIFSRTTFEGYKYLVGNKYTSRRHYYFIHDNYLYLINSKMKSAHMHGIWRDPIEVYRLHQAYQEKSTCFDNNTVEFYTPLELLEAMIEISVIELVQQFNASREDITNDSKDNLIQETK